MKLYIVVNEWDLDDKSEVTLREELYYTLDKTMAKAELDRIAIGLGVDLPHDQESFESMNSPVPGDYYYIQEVELDG